MLASDHANFWNARYSDAGEDYLFGIAPARFVAVHGGLFATGNTVLSVADGEGRNSVWLAQQGLQVTALEVSTVALRKARQLARVNQVDVEFIEANALDFAWPQACFDHVLGVFIQFATATEREALFQGMKQAVKPGGLLLLHGYTPKQLEYRTGGPSAIENLYTNGMLQAAFADFEIIELREYEDDLAEGVAHRGRSALIDLVARRPADSAN
ncbi:MAG: class I SAM-dependent methyltransferase [Sterolibacterium sp.]|nr:class I SAM-dependent methyltransferase [Sterolibacterium sp.]